jgi:hypothetical protein
MSKCEDKDGLSPASCTALGLKNEQSCTHAEESQMLDRLLHVRQSPLLLWLFNASGICILRKNSNPGSSTK